MLTNPTLDQMQALGLAGMAAAWRQLAEQTNAQELSRDEWLGLMLDREIGMRADKRVRNRLALSQAALSRGLHRRHRFCRAARAGPPQHHGARAGRMAEDA
jgi:hypothetical protein